MNKLIFLLAVSIVMAPLGNAQPAAVAAGAIGAAVPPVAQRRPFSVLSPYGARQDDYYWLRDDTRASIEVLDHLRRENAYRDAFMAPYATLQQKLFEEIVARLPPDESSVPVFEHGYWYYRRFEAGSDYPIYARRKASMKAPEETLLDGNAMAKGHEFFHIGASHASPDGRYMAYTEDLVGRRQYTLRVKDLKTGSLLKDAFDNVEADFVWAADSATLLYIEKDPVTLLSERVFKHRLGSTAPKDPLVYEEKDHSYYMSVVKSRSEKYLFIVLDSTQQTEWRYADAADPRLRFKPVLPREADLRYSVDALGADFIIKTNWRAPNHRIVRAPVAHSADKRTWKDIVPHRADVFIEDYELSRRGLVLNERSGGLLRLRFKPWAGSAERVVNPSDAAGVVALLHTPGVGNPFVRYEYSSLIAPTETYDYDLATGRKVLEKTQRVGGGFDKANYRTEFIFATARDGVRVPVTLAYRAGTPLNGTAPLFQYAYGSYGLSSDPEFAADWVSLMDRGFVVAIAHVRGGQELGRQWYEDGRQLHKKNTFTDFIDVTRFLVAKRYAARDEVFAEGGSAGGLLMGAVANMAPEDYRAIVAYVPFVDAVTTMLDDSIPLTSNEYDEWGDPRKKGFYDYMLSYSPYDNVAAKNYPALLVYTSLWDSQVQYYEPAKWVAKLRAMKTDGNPLVFSIDTAAGHGGKSGRFNRYHDTALEYAFILTVGRVSSPR
jgi:oligopeptidase B